MKSNIIKALLATLLAPALAAAAPTSVAWPFNAGQAGQRATADAPLRLVIYIYNLAPTKQVGLSGITVEGEASGAATEVYDLAGRRLPAAAKGLNVVRTVSPDGTLCGKVVVR